MKVGGSIVTYNPEIERLNENIAFLINQVEILIIVDNGSKNNREIMNIISKFDSDRIIFKELSTNKGLAFALNTALEISNNNSCDWLVTMDQDSIVCENYVEKCINCIKLLDSNNVGIISPRIIDRNIEKSESTNDNDDSLRLEKIVASITSGAFTNVNAAVEVGGFDNNMFIDQIDYDFSLNLRVHGFSTFRFNDVYILHELGRIEEKHFFKLKFLTTNHSPQRLYFVFRNYFIIRSKYKNLIRIDEEVREWFKQQGHRLLFRPFKIILGENNKARKIMSILKGTFDGLILHKA